MVIWPVPCWRFQFRSMSELKKRWMVTPPIRCAAAPLGASFANTRPFFLWATTAFRTYDFPVPAGSMIAAESLSPESNLPVSHWKAVPWDGVNVPAKLWRFCFVLGNWVPYSLPGSVSQASVTSSSLSAWARSGTWYNLIFTWSEMSWSNHCAIHQSQTDEYVETAWALGTCHYTVLYSFAEPVPKHTPSSLGDLYMGAELLPLLEHRRLIKVVWVWMEDHPNGFLLEETLQCNVLED